MENIRVKYNEETKKLSFFVDLNKKGTKSSTGRSMVIATTTGSFEKLDDIEGLEGYSVMLKVIKVTKK